MKMSVSTLAAVIASETLDVKGFPAPLSATFGQAPYNNIPDQIHREFYIPGSGTNGFIGQMSCGFGLQYEERVLHGLMVAKYLKDPSQFPYLKRVDLNPDWENDARLKNHVTSAYISTGRLDLSHLGYGDKGALRRAAHIAAIYVDLITKMKPVIDFYIESRPSV